MAQSAPSTLQLGLLPPEVLWLIASHLDYTDLACLVLSSSDLHAQLTRTWTWSMADHSRSEHIGHFLAAVAIRMRPAQFVHDFLGHEFMRNAWAWGCETNELSHAALQCRSRHEWTPDLFAAMCASSYDDDFDLQRAHMGAEHCNSDLVHLSMLVMWVSSQFMGSSCSIADVLQVMIGPKGLMNHFCGSGEGDITFSKKDRERRALAAINADILDECLYMCSNGVQGEGSIDAKAPFGILEMNDGGLYCLCSWAVDLRRLADPFVSIGLLSHRELIDNFLSHSMSAPVQVACHGLRPASVPGSACPPRNTWFLLMHLPSDAAEAYSVPSRVRSVPCSLLSTGTALNASTTMRARGPSGTPSRRSSASHRRLSQTAPSFHGGSSCGSASFASPTSRMVGPAALLLHLC